MLSAHQILFSSMANAYNHAQMAIILIIISAQNAQKVAGPVMVTVCALTVSETTSLLTIINVSVNVEQMSTILHQVIPACLVEKIVIRVFPHCSVLFVQWVITSVMGNALVLVPREHTLIVLSVVDVHLVVSNVLVLILVSHAPMGLLSI